MQLTRAEAKKLRLPLPAKASKYHNKPCVVDGIKFHSKKEAEHYSTLKLLERVGDLRDLRLQPVFRLYVNGDMVCKYSADFAYTTAGGTHVVEDVKSSATKTPVYRLKKKLMKACLGIEVTEI